MLTFVGVGVVAMIVGPAKFVISFGFYFVAFPHLVTFASGSSSSIPALPGWLLAGSYVLPILWIVNLWLTGSRAWDRNSIGGGIAFLVLVALGIATGLFLAAHGASAALRH
jgi:hypothetical protein